MQQFQQRFEVFIVPKMNNNAYDNAYCYDDEYFEQDYNGYEYPNNPTNNYKNNNITNNNNSIPIKVTINQLLESNILLPNGNKKYKLCNKLVLYSNQELILDPDCTIEIPYEYTLHLKEQSLLSNYGTIINDGRIYNHGTINNYNKIYNNHSESKIRNYGILNNMFKATIINNYLLENSNVILNDGYIHNKTSSDFINSSNSILNNNQGKLYIDGNYILEGKVIGNNKIYIKKL